MNHSELDKCEIWIKFKTSFLATIVTINSQDESSSIIYGLMLANRPMLVNLFHQSENPSLFDIQLSEVQFLLDVPDAVMLPLNDADQ